jgi:hypothetical protein
MARTDKFQTVTDRLSLNLLLGVGVIHLIERTELGR